MKKAITYLLPLMFLCILSGIAVGQTKTISGTVRDSSGNALPAVTVTVKGTKTTAVADAQGNFKIQAPAGATLVFSSVGYQPQEVSAERDVVNIQLANQSGQLNEVVVTGFGARTNTRKLAYAVQEVKGEDIVRANNANIINGLQGKVAGVMVNQGAGGPQSSSRIRIRGNTSISSSNTQPLFVVDGILIRPGITGADSW